MQKNYIFGGKSMPSSMLHLLVAKKINPNASIDFYVGNIAPDAHKDQNIKTKTHLRDVYDRESALKELAQKAKNEYLKGMLLHLYTDWKWEQTLLSDFAKKEGENWYEKYNEENSKMVAYAFHNTDWAYCLWEQMALCDGNNFIETEFISKDDVKLLIQRQRNWLMDNKLASSSACPPALIEKFADNVADDFDKWFSNVSH